jgi:hypothetical protein
VEAEVVPFELMLAFGGGGVEEADGKFVDEGAEFVEGREVVDAAARVSGSMSARKGSVLKGKRLSALGNEEK